jgi:pyrroloquinoline quinone (PQQ) biosynthesis protein C
LGKRWRTELDTRRGVHYGVDEADRDFAYVLEKFRMLKLNEPQAKELIAELAAKCDKRWKETVDKTRFMNELREGKLKKETIQLFYRNWGSFVPVINSVYTSAFYKHLWFFVKNVDLMEVYTQKVLDEFGHPSPPGHIQILMSTGAALGLTKEEVLLSPMLPECRALPDFHRTLINDGQIQEYWFSVLWEHPFGNSCLDFFKALTTHYGLSTADASYFSKHHEADTMDHLDRKSHGAVTRTVLVRLLQEGVNERSGYSAEYCAVTPADLNKMFMDGCYNATH